MRLSKCLLQTLRDAPSDAEVPSHKLMVRAGLIHKAAAGVYTYGPFLWRTLVKISTIVRDEMDRAGAQELLLPQLQPQEIWARSGRLQTYLDAGIMFTVKDRKGGDFCLGPTAEEAITDFVATNVRSYKQLPQTLYQSQTKFRDEFRPRFGLMRGREFIMKDAYSFDADDAGLDASYRAMRAAYVRIFERCGLEFLAVQADSGDIGGSGSEEFMVTASTGEDLIVYDDTTGYAANVEKAETRVEAPSHMGDPLPMHVEPTPGDKSVEDLCRRFPRLSAARMVKTILYRVVHRDREEDVAVLMRGDQDVNEVKLKNHLGAASVELADEARVRRVTGCEPGYAGPLEVKDGKLRFVADTSVEPLRNFLCGVNRPDVHALDVNHGRDFPTPPFADLRRAREGDLSPRSEARLKTARGIEVGHVFKLGTKYSAAMDACFLDRDGKKKPFVMGCYGIGVSRIAAAAIEQNHDDKGIVWPRAIAPYQAVVVLARGNDPVAADAAGRIYDALHASGVDTVLDDREDQSAGVKFKDAELVGYPVRVTIGKHVAEGKVEVTVRRTGGTELVPLTEAAARVKALLDAMPSGRHVGRS
ncbi:MAG: proline--tRNA ligase [Planctomycetes bacterium]|nr:proline--tRNA ligase [Planctomycetota bacterium]